MEYVVLNDDDEEEGQDGEGKRGEEDEDQATVVLQRKVAREQDPLADAFGNDAMTWGEMHAGSYGLSLALTVPPMWVWDWDWD